MGRGNPMEKQYYIYIITNKRNTVLYTGITNDLKRRIYEHKENLVDRKPSMDWESLRKDLMKYGMKHCTLTCQMPVESSSACQNASNGVEPVRALKSYKSSKKKASLLVN